VPELHLDQSVLGTLVHHLRQLHYVVVTARGLGMQAAEDADHLLHAAQHSRVVITKDKDYLVLQVAWLKWPPAWNVPTTPNHAGILVIYDHWPSAVAAQEVHTALSSGWPLTNWLHHFEVPVSGPPRWVRD